jgi:hypothetical protein
MKHNENKVSGLHRTLLSNTPEIQNQTIADLEDPVKGSRGKRNICQVTFAGLAQEDLKETELLCTHAGVNSTEFFRLLLKAYRGCYRVQETPEGL